MSVFNKILTAIRGGAREAGESIVDKNSIRIFKQEIKDAQSRIAGAKQDLTKVMAEEMKASREIASLKSNIETHEGYAVSAIEKGDESLAMDVANKIVELSSSLSIQEGALAKFAAHSKRLQELVKQSTVSIQALDRELTMVETTENVQRAISVITENQASSSSSLLSAKESLDRIKKRQQDTDDRLAAGESLTDELDGGSLESRLADAGIGKSSDDASDVLARLKAKKE